MLVFVQIGQGVRCAAVTLEVRPCGSSYSAGRCAAALRHLTLTLAWWGWRIPPTLSPDTLLGHLLHLCLQRTKRSYSF